MKINKNVKIVSTKTVLVPYERKHVLKYHEWMKSKELQTLTASEPLTLEEEYDMQLSWKKDENKCTFIVLGKEGYDDTELAEIDCMIGDVNLFFNDPDDKTTAEIEIMIAEPSARGKGHGKEALLCMMRYGFEDLGLDTVTAKIGYSNKPSIHMFTKIGFTEVSRSEVFEEITLELKFDKDSKSRISNGCGTYEKQSYDPAPS